MRTRQPAETATQPPAGSSVWRKLCRALLKLIGALLVICLCLYAVAFWQCWRLEPTGDALFDRFARAVRNRNAWRLYGPWAWQAGTRSLLPEAAVAKWEKDFGSDPRYWQMRYTCRQWDYNLPATAKTRADALAYFAEPLQHAADAGIADAQTYAMLYQALHEPVADASTAGSNLKAAQALDSALKLEPDRAWFHYLNALSHTKPSVADFADDGVLPELKAGNAAPDLTPPRAFPSSYVCQFANDQGRVPGNPVLAGAVLARYFEPLPGISERLRLCRALEGQAFTSGPSELLAEYIRFECRSCQTAQATSTDELFASSRLLVVLNAYAASVSCPLDAQQRKDLARLLGVASRLRHQTDLLYADQRAAFARSFAFYISLDGLNDPFANPFSVADDSFSAPLYLQYAFQSRALLAEREMLLSINRRALTWLSRYDYANVRAPSENEGKRVLPGQAISESND